MKSGKKLSVLVGVLLRPFLGGRTSPWCQRMFSFAPQSLFAQK